MARRAGFDLFSKRADGAVRNCRDTLRTMTQGFLVNERLGEFEFSMEAFGKAKRSIKATTGGDVRFWESEYGKRYFESNLAAIKRGVEITRVFVQPVADLQKIVGVLGEQQKAGIRVYLVQPQALPGELAEDYLIMDDAVLSLIELTPDRQDRRERIWISKEEVSKKVSTFGRLLSIAVEVRKGGTVQDAIDRLR